MIVRAAVKIKFFDAYTAREIIIPCHRHCDAFYILKEFGFHRHADYEEIEQGFLNGRGEFLTRVEAKQEAIRCNQLINHTNDVNLYSEDVW